MLLYDSPVSGNCWKVRQILTHAGHTFERREVSVTDRSNRRQLLGELNPALRVPVLLLDDGRPLAESNAILTYFGDEAGLLPADRYERAQVMQWLFFEQYSHEPNLAVARFLLAISDETPNPRLIAHLHQQGNAALDAMETHLADREFFVAGRYSIADIALYAYTHVAEEGGFSFDQRPALRRWLARVAQQPGHLRLEE